MPLIRPSSTQAVRHDSLRSIGFWMVEADKEPQRPVRVMVSYEALSQFDPSDIRDLTAAFEHFDRFRDSIERAASAKFDRGEIDDEKYEGQPLIRLRTADF